MNPETLVTCPSCLGSPDMVAMNLSKGIAFKTQCSLCKGKQIVSARLSARYARGKRLKKARLALGYGLRQAAERWNMKPSDLCKIENGQGEDDKMMSDFVVDWPAVTSQDGVLFMGRLRFQCAKLPEEDREAMAKKILTAAVIAWCQETASGKEALADNHNNITWAALHFWREDPSLLDVLDRHGLWGLEYDLHIYLEDRLTEPLDLFDPVVSELDVIPAEETDVQEANEPQ